jgi:hypothetical protein
MLSSTTSRSMATEMNRKRPNNEGEARKEPQLDCVKECNDDKIMEAVEMAMNNFGFCPDRIWAAAKNLEGKEKNLPKLFPTHDAGLKQMFAHEGDQGNHENDKNDVHSQCNFDFCQQSQTNFTSVEQHHESPSCEQLRRNRLRGCDPHEDLFLRDILDEVSRHLGRSKEQ